jgi:hypothetical protein
VGALELSITSLVLRLVEVDDAGSGGGEYYENLARTIVDIFLHGLSAEGAGA